MNEPNSIADLKNAMTAVLDRFLPDMPEINLTVTANLMVGDGWLRTFHRHHLSGGPFELGLLVYSVVFNLHGQAKESGDKFSEAALQAVLDLVVARFGIQPTSDIALNN